MNDKQNNSPQKAEQIVEKAVRAIREVRVPQGPPGEVVESVLTAGNGGRSEFAKGSFGMNWIMKIAAAILIVVGIGAVIGLVTQGSGGSGVAFAAVAQQFRNARTVTYTMITDADSEAIPTMRMEMSYKQPGYWRMTGGAGSVVGITDGTQKKAILINHSEKQFSEMNFSNLPQDKPEIEFFEWLRTLPDRADEVLGEKEMDGRRVQGFRVSENGMTGTFWIDTETGDLTRVEMEFPNAPGTHGVMTDFQFDLELEDSLFSLTPPEGYTQGPQIDTSPIDQDDLVKFLRWWSTHNRDGLFPPSLNHAKLAEAVMEMIRTGKLVADQETTKDKQQRDTLQITRGIMFVMMMKPESDWHYAGKGVKLGDADTAIFWYKPEGSETYQVIYGDLSIKELAKADLPR
ncbi:MAG: hypothetical protein KAT11_06620 [Phycisphaerae bacterium]|nr:hypothetical protein [Phycisphaerae bacterium]